VTDGQTDDSTTTRNDSIGPYTALSIAVSSKKQFCRAYRLGYAWFVIYTYGLYLYM